VIPPPPLAQCWRGDFSRKGGRSLVKVIVSMYLLGFEAACTPTERGSLRSLEVISMRQEIISFAHALFPGLDTINALEMLLLLVYATIDDYIFAAEDAEEYPDACSAAEDNAADYEVWDYVY
jgi:hypothetical protein